jgi:PAS domain S-box-containing protein
VSSGFTVESDIESLRDENKRLRLENKKLARELKYEQGINERNRVNAEARASLSRVVSAEKSRLEQYMNLMLGNCPDIILLFDQEGRIVFASDSYLRRSKIPAIGMILGKTYSELMVPVVADEFLLELSEIFQMAQTEKRSVEVEQDIDFGLDGNARHYQTQVTPMIDDDGSPRGMMMFFYDTTELMRAKLEAERARFQAEQSTRAKSDFLSRMSHEMRTPMNAIIGMTLIAKSAKDPERKEYCLDKISEASTHLLGVINDILDMSKIEANKFELSFSEFNFEKMLQRVTNVMNFKVEEMEQNLLVEISPDMPSRIISDEQRLAQVMTNLLSNAVKFTPQGGTVSLSVKRLGEADKENEAEEKEGSAAIRVEVKDTGIGISLEQQARLFASFEQADGSISRKYGGTGLGLAISKSIVELMGGRIWVESELGNGASFIFEIRVKTPECGRVSLLPPGVNWENIKILAVDDSPEVLELIKAILAPYGVKCETVLYPREALSLVRERAGDPFDVIFIDWRMPEMDGIELSREINRGSGRNPVVIMISATDWDEISSVAREAGVSRFLQKPLFPSAMFNCINECMGCPSQADEGAFDETAPTEGIFARRNVLLAEDVKINREIVTALMEDTGIIWDYAEDGEEAVEKFSNDPEGYDLVLMDVQMPNMDGYGAARRIRSSGLPRSRTIPIIAMTANVFREDIERCREAGMDDHIGKPIDINEVISKLKRYMP